jgi:tRNA(fMet)-specific endonuclease VapC
MFLLDTNSCIDFTLARSDALRQRVRQSYGQGLAISTITLAELRVGARHANAGPDDARHLDLFISALRVHPFDAAAAEKYGILARDVGVRRRSFDRLIAAHALALDLTLVTNNEADFNDIPGLRVENWTR